MKFLKIFLVLLILMVAVVWRLIYIFLGPVGFWGQEIIFEVPERQAHFEVARSLKDQGIIRSTFGYRWLASKLEKGLKPVSGGYAFRGRFWAWRVAERLGNNPDYIWFTSHGCVRREQVGDELARVLSWGKQERSAWDKVFDQESANWEGVYFPSTYLFSLSATPEQIANQFIVRFEQEVAHLEKERRRQNLDWSTVLKIASLIQREAGGVNDMGVVSGVIYNRLDQGMRLQIDATMQYTLGQRADGSWWGPVNLDQKWSLSPYNTYLYEGLPPTPICSPGLSAIEAALEPEETDCLYYLHDRFKQIHCARTYAEHKQNIDRYLD